MEGILFIYKNSSSFLREAFDAALLALGIRPVRSLT